jgi:myo-inositol-1(or 4)-monophosphatase
VNAVAATGGGTGEPLGELLELALAAARAAGAVLLRERAAVVGHGAASTKSSRSDPVTEADLAAQRAIAELITGARPEDSLLGEEGLSHEGSTGWRWVVDPLDGTVNYLRGRDDWAVSIAVRDADGVAVGVVHAPALGRTYSAARGRGSWEGGQRLSVRRAALADSLVGTGFSYLSEGRARQARALTRVLPSVADLRRGGSAALDLAAVAQGSLDAFYEDDLAPWDWMAGALLVTEAGGVVSALTSPQGGGVLAAAPALHAELAALLGGPAD